MHVPVASGMSLGSKLSDLISSIGGVGGGQIAVDRRPQLRDRLEHHIVRSDMTEIAQIRAREILDSRGNPTVEADVDSGRWFHRPRSRTKRRLDRRA